MDPENMKTLLESIAGFADKVTWFEWPIGEAPALPFICYFTVRENDFAADNVNYYSMPVYAVELYCKNRDFATEAKVAEALSAAGLYYSKEAEYLDDERCWVTVFTV